MQREGLKRKDAILMAGIQARKLEKAKLQVFGVSLLEIAKRLVFFECFSWILV